MARLPERLEATVETMSRGGKAREPTVRTEPGMTSALIGNQPRLQGARQTSGASFHRPEHNVRLCLGHQTGVSGTKGGPLDLRPESGSAGRPWFPGSGEGDVQTRAIQVDEAPAVFPQAEPAWAASTIMRGGSLSVIRLFAYSTEES